MITGLVDDAGKKLYSNEDARRAAFSEMAEDDIELSELKEKNAQIERAIQEFRISFDCLNNEQKNIRAVLMFLSGKGE
jgi:FtsZ-binding cell division protein ZapB